MRVVTHRSGTSLVLVPAAAFLLALVAGASPPPPEPVPSSQGATDVAREILKIQQELGGSVVRLPAAELEPPLPKIGSPLNLQTSPERETKDPVVALRTAGLQLDLMAHRLELLDLYDQADATRQLAQQFREDARQLKQARNPEKAE